MNLKRHGRTGMHLISVSFQYWTQGRLCRLKCVRSYYIQISCVLNHIHLASLLLDPTRILSYGFIFSDYFSSQENFNLILITCIEFCLQGQIKKLALQGQALSSSTVCLGTVIFPQQMPQYCSNFDLELLLMK